MKKTPLHSRHIELGARMAPFAGFEMPISYDPVTGGMLKEHLAVRENAGIFDVSHMGEFWVKGPDATAFLTYACTRPFEKLPDFKAQYCLLTTDRGTIVDDIIVYRMNHDVYWVVVNASNIEKDFNHLQNLSSKFKVKIENVSDSIGLIALQGPRAAEIMSMVVPEALNLKYYQFLMRPNGWIIGRTGYTGEDGFEIFLPAAQTRDLWMKFEALKAVPIGLGARDTLRLEVGFPLYGHELTEDLQPNETFSAFAVDLHSTFFGSEKARQSPRFRPVAVYSKAPKPIREGDKLLMNGKLVGRITSGSMSPIRREGVGLGLLDLSAAPTPLSKDAVFMLESAGKQREAFLTQTPFVATARVKGHSELHKKVS